MSTATSPSVKAPSRRTYACIRCAERKIRCDRQKPCAACVKHNVDCVYNTLPVSRRKRKPAVDHVLTDRLRYYETLLQEQGIDPGQLPDSNPEQPRESHHDVAVAPEDIHLPTPSSTASEPSQTINKTQVLHGQGRSKFIDNYLWTRVAEEFHDPEDALDESSTDASDLEASDDDLVLSTKPKTSVRARHPPPEIINQLWEVFVERIDPLTKVVHVPTLQPAVQEVTKDTTHIPRSFEALMFAIYSAAVMSLNDHECRERFGEPRKTLLSRYISATKRALCKAKFMGTISLVVLQAFVIHIISVRDNCDPRTMWSLTGVAVRIAQSMGLERDGSSLNLPPFESEMRRRVWWLLKTHDFRTAELCGLPKFRDIEVGADSTKFPTNTNDNQLYPGMPAVLPDPTALTDCAFISLRYELTKFASARVVKFREQGKTPSQWDLHASGEAKSETDNKFKAVEQLLETKYLRYCDPSQPLHLMTTLMARCAMDFIQFLMHHPRRWPSIEQTPFTERQLVWELSIKFLERYEMLQTSIQLKRFAWHAPYFLQWHIFIHVLDTIRADPNIPDIVKAWRLIESTYKSNPQMIYDTRKPIHVAVGNLTLKAYTSRKIALQMTTGHLSTEPEFILQLRQQRDAAIAKKQAQGRRGSKPEQNFVSGHANSHQTNNGLEGETIYLNDALGSVQLEQQPSAPTQSFIQPNTIGEGDPFWFLNAFENHPAGNSNDVMDMDVNFLLAEDYSMDGYSNQTVTWDQWDTWLAESNKMRPMLSAQDSTPDMW